jgi:hypothetical protein
MRSHAAALIAAIVLAVPLTAGAAETWTCWSAIDDRGDDGSVQATRCRLAGETGTVDYGSVSEVPVVLAPQVGTDGDGVCWYWTTRASAWVLLGVDDHGNATMGIDPDGVVGGPVIIDAIYPRCTSEPTEAANALTEAYELLARYDHPAPGAVVDPPPGAGIVGMDVLLADAPPDAWSASLVSPHSGRTIEVETFVEVVEIDWGDGSTTVVPEAAFGLLTGWPDGEIQSCLRRQDLRDAGRASMSSVPRFRTNSSCPTAGSPDTAWTAGRMGSNPGAADYNDGRFATTSTRSCR